VANKTAAIKKQVRSTNSLIAVLMTACMFAIVASFLLSKELLADIRFNQKVLGRKNDVNGILKNNVDALEELQKNYEILQKDGPSPSRVIQALPVDSDYAGIAGEYEAMATASGARLTSVALDAAEGEAPAASGTSPQLVRFRITAIGSYDSLQKLTKNIETSLRPSRIQTINISGAEPAVTADFILETSFQPRTSVDVTTETIQ